MWLYIFLTQVVVIAIIVVALKKILDKILIEAAIRQLNLCRPEQKVDQVCILSHKILSRKFSQQILQVIRKRFGEQTRVVFQVERGLLGGLVVKAGVDAIDCSLRDRLRQARGNKP